MSDQTYQVGEKEYGLEELQNLIEKGNYALEMEQKYNTPFENAWSAYGKTQNENKDLKEKISEYEKGNGSQKWQEEAKKTFLTRDELDQEVEQRIATREQIKDITSQFKKLEKDIDGTDGRPKFDNQEILDYMKENNLLDPEKAYNLKHMDQIAEWKAKQMIEKPEFANPSGHPAANKQPVQTKFNRDNLGAAISEALGENSGKI